jgi:PAS domain S-box-containing protein
MMKLRPLQALFSALLLMLVVGLIGEFGINLEQERVRQEQRSRVTMAIGQYRAALEAELNASLYLTNGLIAYVATHTSLSTDDAQLMLKTLYEQGRHVRNIALAPGNRIRYVYPLKGNEAALGLYYPEVAAQWPAVERAMRDRQPRLAGPVALKQGGTGFIYRVPVFIGLKGDYWGILSMVLNEDSLYAKTGIAPEVDGLQLALRGRDGLGAEGEVFMGNASLFSDDNVTATVSTPGGTWQIAARPSDGWTTAPLIGRLRAAAWSSGALLGFLFYQLLIAIDRRMRSTRALAESQKTLAAILDNLPLAVSGKEIRNDFRICLWNKQAEKIFGLPANAIFGKTSSDLYPAEKAARVYQEDTAASVSAEVIDIPEVAIDSPLGHRVLHTRKIAICDDSGEPTTLLELSEDITEHQKAQLELIRHRDHLEELVDARTDELLFAKDAAEAANRAKSTFLSNMSHELRTPMSAIIGLTQLILRQSPDAKIRDRLEKVDHASQRLLALINDILDISKIEAECMTLAQVSFKLGENLHKIFNLFSQKATDKGLQLHLDLPADLQTMPLTGDPFRLDQILLNLTGNAIKFTEKGMITVRCRAEEDGATSIRLRFEVEDSGIGISPDDQPRLFTAFEQADGSTTRKYGGTGLGLAISKRLVQMMDGEIGVDSASGQGSTFWFTVRLRKTTFVASTQDAFGTNHAAERELVARYAGTSILLAEDEPINQEVCRALLEDVGLVVDLANDGLEAVQQARRKRYDLILMDMQMPNLNGIDAAQAIRTDSLNAATPILALTANAFAEDKARCLAAGMNDHIAKPVEPTRLFESILIWLEKSATH